jgi:2-polyprenyl-3-methyl-5-hydroxy-6-metoxy-1,4-benzoquinol methylase
MRYTNYSGSYRGRKDKQEFLVKNFGEFLSGSVLDVGCGNSNLRQLLSTRCQYTGIDLFGNPDIVVNLEERLPFENKSYDTIVALDVLEHVDRIYHLIDEVCRVSRKYIVLSLPNMYEITFRAKYLFGKRLSEKYGLPINCPADRHKWLVSYEDARNFVHSKAKENKFNIVREFPYYYAYNFLPLKLLMNTAKTIKLSPNLLAWAHWSVWEKQDEMG